MLPFFTDLPEWQVKIQTETSEPAKTTLKGNVEPPYAAPFSAATQTDVVIDLNKETEEEE